MINSKYLACVGGDVTASANIGDNIVVRGDGGVKGIQGSTVKIEDNGDVGISVDPPTSRLHVWSTTDANGIQCDGNNNPGYVVAHSGVVKVRMGSPTVNGSYSTDSIIGDLVFRVETNTKRILINANAGVGAAEFFISNGGVHAPGMKTGNDQGAAGAAAGELWADTNDAMAVKLGV